MGPISVLLQERAPLASLWLRISDGEFFHWQPFFFIYLLEFAMALMVADSMVRVPSVLRLLFVPIAGTAVMAFVLYGGLIKFSGNVPVDPTPYRGVMEWVSTNTSSRSVFLVAPPPEDRQHQDLLLIQEIRALYYGAPYQVKDVGLDRYDLRREAALRTYTDGTVPPGVDFVFYGPYERARFPHFLGVGRVVYEDSNVRVFDVRANQVGRWGGSAD